MTCSEPVTIPNVQLVKITLALARDVTRTAIGRHTYRHGLLFDFHVSYGVLHQTLNLQENHVHNQYMYEVDSCRSDAKKL